MRVHCATTNLGKLREFQAAAGTGISIEALPGLREIEPPEETGHTFEENASAKAVYYSRFTDEYLFVDDSGLAVDALDGEPGVYSARYAGQNASDADNNALVLERMRDVENRTARFVCVIALARRGEVVRIFRAEVQGRLLQHPQGDNGFGYDPIFYYPPFGSSFGEVPRERKQTVSHRGQALRAMLEYLSSF
jgi:XTP/dITP diphosphohydrolase